ncbi:hypothetical protein XELAEV_18025344mg [Xenopus laevis]|uniref:Uncharacterized protein n=1 Tax=Xenopus laevis TaxID=8355 RepID=A0A974D1I4_XENLA|nr:hypothetical protein XELAEV_18025344mg [Xenopus laevis]
MLQCYYVTKIPECEWLWSLCTVICERSVHPFIYAYGIPLDLAPPVALNQIPGLQFGHPMVYAEVSHPY